MVVANRMNNIADLMQYVNIQTQLHGVIAWQEHYLRFRDRRDFDVCGQLLLLLHASERNTALTELETFYKAELDLLKDRFISAERAVKYLVENSNSLNTRALALTRLADV